MENNQQLHGNNHHLNVKTVDEIKYIKQNFDIAFIVGP